MASLRSRSATIAGAGALGGAILVLGLAVSGLSQPTAVRSVEVVDDDVVVHQSPSAGASRRGKLAQGQRLPFVARAQGSGCRGGDWIQIGDQAFVCEGD